jgi:hypothetical protein
MKQLYAFSFCVINIEAETAEEAMDVFRAIVKKHVELRTLKPMRQD